ncbi:MAG: CotH kinase family protein [Bacteroidota bacterium]
MRDLKRLSFCAIIPLFLFISSCESEERVSPKNTDAFLKDIIAIDREEALLLYNGENIDVTQASLSLDNDEIIINSDSSQGINLGELYSSEWRESSYSFFRTELPILKIQTRKNVSIGEEYASSEFALIEKGKLSLSGNLGIKLRGNTSLTFPKKSYRLELWEDEQGQINRDAAVLNMREDDDWLLDGMWNEPLSIRDKSAMEICLSFARVQDVDASDISLGGAREYCELFIDGVYKGLYYIGERLDRKQLKLEKCNDQSDGGELYKAKAWDAAVIAFSLPEFDNNDSYWGGYEIKYPQEVGKYDWQKLKGFIEFFKGNPPDNFENLYPQRVDVDNIIDYFILINVIGAFDNAGNNVFIARKNQSSPYYFVSWDYDTSLGIGINGDPFNLEASFIQHSVSRQLWLSPLFKDKLKSRWENLRVNQLSNEKLISYYQNNHAILMRNKVYEREAMISNLSKSLPDPSAMNYLEETLEQRLAFLDEAIDNL